ncbi:MAG: DUF1579 family protein [Planctomycetota bacterium]|jgi:hypothetical protein
MKLRWTALGFAFGVAALLMTADVLSQEAPEPDDDMEQMMKLWEKYALPGPFHEKLEFYVGTWDVTTKFWMEGPDELPAESKSTMWCRAIMGGRFIETRGQGTMSFEYKGQVVDFPVESVGYIGYDNFKEKYVGTWIESSGTAMYHSEGTVDDTGKVFTYFSVWDEWETGRRNMPYKMTDTILDANTVVTEFHDMTMPAGKSLVMQMTSRRKNADPAGAVEE